MRRIIALLILASLLIGCNRVVTPTPSPAFTIADIPAPRVTPTTEQGAADAPTEPPAAPTAALVSPYVGPPTPTALAAPASAATNAAPDSYPAPLAALAAGDEATPEAERAAAQSAGLDTTAYPAPNETLPSNPPTPVDAMPTDEPTPAPTGAPTRTPLPTLTAAPTNRPAVAPSATPTRRPASPAGLPDTGPAGRTSNIGPYLLMNPEAGQPTHNLLQDGPMRAYMAINPAHWTPADQLPQMEGYGRNWIPEGEELDYIRDGAEGARRYFDRFKDTYEQTRGNIHAWMSTWAFRFDDQGFAEQWVAFQREWLRLMHDHGYRAGVGGQKTHLFDEGEIKRLAPAIADADYLFLAESGAPTLRGSFGVTTLLYRDLVDELLETLPANEIPPLILDVCVDGQVNKDIGKAGDWWQRGYRDFGTSRADYADDVRAYDLETLKDPYVKHVFWFATNITDDTLSFDVNTDMLAIAEGWHRP